MNFDDVIKKMESKYTNVQIDKARFKQDLQLVYKQNVNNINLPIVVLEKILFEPLSLSDYAEEYKVSYSSIQQNRGRYATLIRKGKNYCIAKYELFHGKRGYGKTTEYLVQKNHKMIDLLREDSLKSGKSIPSIIYNIIRKHYNI